jgi:hypothetical protein
MELYPISGPEAICDFCDGRPVAKTYDAAPVLTTFASKLVLFSETRWTACKKCAELIDQGRWEELTERATECWLKELRRDGGPSPYLLRAALKQDLQLLHARFREAMGRTA